MHTSYVLRLLSYACVAIAFSGQDVKSSTLNDTDRGLIPVSSRVDRGRSDQSQAPMGVDIAAIVNGKQFQAQGNGQCKHEANGSIYGSTASLWIVEYTDPKSPLRHLNLTVWHVKGENSNQMSLNLQTGTVSHRIATVKGGKIEGSGTVTFQPEKSGGRFEIRGKNEKGDTVEVKITCPSFSNIVAEGG